MESKTSRKRPREAEAVLPTYFGPVNPQKGFAPYVPPAGAGAKTSPDAGRERPIRVAAAAQPAVERPLFRRPQPLRRFRSVGLAAGGQALSFTTPHWDRKDSPSPPQGHGHGEGPDGMFSPPPSNWARFLGDRRMPLLPPLVVQEAARAAASSP